MKLSLKPHHLKRYKDIALLFWKYGSTDLAKEFEQAAAGDEKTPLAAKPGQPVRREEIILEFSQRHPDYFGVPFAFGFGDSFKTSAAISLPALNFTIERAGIGTSVSGLLGLRPTLALRILTSNTPKFRSSTLSPLAKDSVM